MGNAISFIFDGRECFARELTARQIDQVLGGPPRRIEPLATGQPTPADRTDETPGPGTTPPGKDVEAVVPPAPATSGGFHIFDLLFSDEPVSSLAASLSTGLTLDELNGDVSPVELETVMRAVKEANPFLVRAVQNGERLAKRFEEQIAKILASRSGGLPTS